jgi:hypothetical protein
MLMTTLNAAEFDAKGVRERRRRWSTVRRRTPKKEQARLRVKILNLRSRRHELGRTLEQYRESRALNDTPRGAVECAVKRLPRSRLSVIKRTQFPQRSREGLRGNRAPVTPHHPRNPSDNSQCQGASRERDRPSNGRGRDYGWEPV